MSIEAVAWALTVPIGGNAKVILIGIANHADAYGRNAWPSVDTLAAYAYCDRRTVQRNLRQLENAGLIAKADVHFVKGRADRAITVYDLTGWQNATPPTRNGAARVP